MPWTSAHMRAKGYAGIAKVYFPHCIYFVGFASGPECSSAGSMAFLRFNCDEVTLPNYDDVFKCAKGMFYPFRYPRGRRVLCVRTVCHCHELHEKNHRISAGVTIVDDCVYEMTSPSSSCAHGSSSYVDESYPPGQVVKLTRVAGCIRR